MQENTMLATTLRNTFTRADFYRRVDLLQELLEHFFFDPSAHEAGRAEVIRSYRGAVDVGADDREAISAWGDEVLNAFDPHNLHERIRELKRAADALPKFTLYVPVHLPPAQVSMLGAWCRAHVQPGLLLDIHVDPSATGGCVFAYGSALHDFSLSYFMRKERPALMTLVRTYGA